MIEINEMNDFVAALAAANPGLTDDQAEQAAVFIGDTPEIRDDDGKVRAEIDGAETWLVMV